MGATPSHEDDGDNVADPEDSDDDDDILKMQNGRYRVSSNRLSSLPEYFYWFFWKNLPIYSGALSNEFRSVVV